VNEVSGIPVPDVPLNEVSGIPVERGVWHPGARRPRAPRERGGDEVSGIPGNEVSGIRTRCLASRRTRCLASRCQTSQGSGVWHPGARRRFASWSWCDHKAGRRRAREPKHCALCCPLSWCDREAGRRGRPRIRPPSWKDRRMAGQVRTLAPQRLHPAPARRSPSLAESLGFDAEGIRQAAAAPCRSRQHHPNESPVEATPWPRLAAE
jgi:hypothetical protein